MSADVLRLEGCICLASLTGRHVSNDELVLSSACRATRPCRQILPYLSETCWEAQLLPCFARRDRVPTCPNKR